MTHDNRRQKINDQLGNPIEVGIVVVWRVVNTAKALFNVDDYDEEQGIFSGYGAVVGNIDDGGDIIEPGAFTKTLSVVSPFQGDPPGARRARRS